MGKISKSVMFECPKGCVVWRIPRNRIAQNKVTPCPVCGRKPTNEEIFAHII